MPIIPGSVVLMLILFYKYFVFLSSLCIEQPHCRGYEGPSPNIEESCALPSQDSLDGMRKFASECRGKGLIMSHLVRPLHYDPL